MRSRCIIKHQKTKFWSFVTFLEVVLVPLDPAQTSAEIQQFWIGTKNSQPIGHSLPGIPKTSKFGCCFHQHSIFYLSPIQAEVILQGTLYLSPDVGSGGSSRAGLGPERQRSGRRVPRCTTDNKIPGSRQATEEQLLVNKRTTFLHSQPFKSAI